MPMAPPKPRPTKIHLDVDGVLTDWTSSACRLFGRDPDDVRANWPAGVWDLAVALDISKNKLWRAVDAAGADFWADLELFPWAMDLVCLCQSLAPTTLLTSPSRHPSSHEGKFRWIARHFGDDFTGYLIGPDKVAAASPYSVLIDDRAAGLERYAIGPDRWARDPVPGLAERTGRPPTGPDGDRGPATARAVRATVTGMRRTPRW